MDKTLWAKSFAPGSATDGVAGSAFESIALDASGNIYAVGTIDGAATTPIYNFGNSITVTPGTTANLNSVIVKYNSDGLAQWAKSVVSGSSYSKFLSVVVGQSGDIYAVGYLNNNGTYQFGEIGVCGSASGGNNNVVIVKYNSSGIAQWAKGTVAGLSDSKFYAVAVDSNENLYAAGHISGTDAYEFGGSAIVTGISPTTNVALVKYDSNGNAQWARSFTYGPTTGAGISEFWSINIDTSNNLYLGGVIGPGTYGFGNDINATGTNSSGYGGNAVIVKYDSSGNAQWANSVAGTGDSWFEKILLDSDKNIYVCGSIYGSSLYSLGNDVNVAGSSDSTGNVLLAKYDKDGSAQWAKSVIGSSESLYYSLDLDNNEDIYLGGYIVGDVTYNFGNNVTVTGAYSSGKNALLIKYADLPPTLANITKAGYENAAINFAEADFIDNFVGYLNNSLTEIKPESLPGHGTLKLANVDVLLNQTIPVGNLSSLSYVPNTGYLGSDNFKWNGKDGLLYATSAADVNINVNDQPPTLSEITKSLAQDTILTFATADFTDHFNGFQGNPLVKIKITNLPINGSLKLNTTPITLNQEIIVGDLTNLSYTPTPGYFGTDSFSWNGSDGTMYAESEALVQLAITPNSFSSSSSGTFAKSSESRASSTSMEIVSSLSSGDSAYSEDNKLASSLFSSGDNGFTKHSGSSSELDKDNGGKIAAIVGGVVGGAIVATVAGVAIAKGMHYYYRHNVHPRAQAIASTELSGV